MNSVAPGWFVDPAVPGYLRWWDGLAWTVATHPIYQSPSYQHPPPRPAADPVADLAEERQLGRRARIALIGGAVVYAVQFFVVALMYGQMFASMREDWRQVGTLPRGHASPPPFDFQYLMLFELIGLVLTLALLVVAVMFVMWFYKAATIGARAGVAATWEPVWAIVGFIIPVVQFWFPYQSARDTLPVGHPARGLVKLWWGLWIAMIAMGYPVMIAALFSTPVALAFAVIGAAVAVAGAITARRMIDRVNDAHAELLSPTS